jgi:succinate-semialdehyde dehydrogenase/glutarate-semialdehyde dehydrogenase
MQYRTLNPATGELIESYAPVEESGVEAALVRASAAFRPWREASVAWRAERLEGVARALEERATELALLMALEMGKPLAEGEAEARKCAWGCRYFAASAATFLAAVPRESDGSAALVRFEPLGPILAIMPWNFPFWQFFRFAAPALMAGNVILLKHAPNTPRCALTIERLVLEGGVPEAVVQNLFLTNEQAARVIADPRVRGVTLTGSTRAGREVAATAGRHLKTMVLELGGSDPFIVLEDADVALAARTGVAARCVNSGQSCIAAKRFLVHASVFEAFRDRFVEGMRRRVVGDPMDRGVDVGPLAREDLRDRLAAQVRATLAAGAEALCGGEVPEGRGFFYPPTVLAGAPPGTPVRDEELFGPVATLIAFTDDEQALAVSNASRYGLAASLWTRDRARAERLIPHLDVGSVFVNGLVKSDPRLPFGGVKDSGFGRELGREGMLEFVNLKTVWIG